MEQINKKDIKQYWKIVKACLVKILDYKNKEADIKIEKYISFLQKQLGGKDLVYIFHEEPLITACSIAGATVLHEYWKDYDKLLDDLNNQGKL